MLRIVKVPKDYKISNSKRKELEASMKQAYVDSLKRYYAEHEAEFPSSKAIG